MESLTSTWAHLQRTGPEALLFLGVGITVCVLTAIVVKAIEYAQRVITKLLTRD